MPCKPRVLLLHDEAAPRAELSSRLAGLGFRVDEESEVVDALRGLDARSGEACPYQLLLARAGLPEFSSLRVLQAIHRTHPSLTVGLLGEGAADDEQSVALPERPSAAELTAILEEARRALGDATVLGGHLFLRLAADAEPERVFTTLRALEGLVWLDAVRGDWSLLATLQGGEAATLEAIAARARAVTGVSESELHVLVQPALPPSLRAVANPQEHLDSPLQSGPGLSALYALVEVSPERLGEVFSRLLLLPEVAMLGAELNGARLHARVEAASFDRLRAVLNDRIRFMDGVLRIDELVIVVM